MIRSVICLLDGLKRPGVRTGMLVVALASLGMRQGPASILAGDQSTPRTIMKSESFDRDPAWEGFNNRSARIHEPRHVRQDFGFSAQTNHAGGLSPGEIGGFITPAREAAFYGTVISPKNLDQPLSASGKLLVGKGRTHVLLGFFNAGTVNEWRTPNTIALRLLNRGDKFFAYVEYCTAKWRAGGDTTPFPTTVDAKRGRSTLIGFPCEKSLRWSLVYDPKGNHGHGEVTATIDNATAVCRLEASHKQDGATFNRFGLLNVMKSAVAGSEVWIDDVRVNGGETETFARDPHWDRRNNRTTIQTRVVRPWFDFGFSDSHFAGGKSRGELGGQIFRGDCRYLERMACYGDRVGPLTLKKPLTASGKVAMTRGVSDSTTFFGFYNSRDSMRRNDSQRDMVPESAVGIQIEGPSRDGFRFYPVARPKGENGQSPPVRNFPFLHPDGMSHDWKLEFEPGPAEAKGRITVTLDGQSNTFDLEPGTKARGTTFDRFGIVTSWIDGNSQDIYWDDIMYTQRQ